MEVIHRIVSQIDAVFIHSDSSKSDVAQRCIKYFPKNKIKFVDDEPFKQKKGELSADEFLKSKKNIYIKKFNGQFFKRCPGAHSGLTCCNYFVLNLGQQCNLNCSYCYLQSFINSPLLYIYSNIDQALKELSQIYKEIPASTALRIGTGELIDSLSLDPLTNYSVKLIRFFKNYPNWRLEFKTKSDFVDQFIQQDHANNVIASWSVNPEYIIDQEEHKTASLNQRLKAAEKCRRHKFLIAFHIDPVIWHSQWKKNYTDLVNQITSLFSPKDVSYISIGALRFQPQQTHIMRERFGMHSLVTSAEMFLSKDGKLRYDKRLRQKMFQYIVDEFKKNNANWNIFLCMETPETWLQSMNHLPKKNDVIRELFNHQVTRSVQKAHNLQSNK